MKKRYQQVLQYGSIVPICEYQNNTRLIDFMQGYTCKTATISC